MAFQRWESLWEETEYEEIVALDVHRVALAIEAVVAARNLRLRFADGELYRELLYYVWLRLNGRDADQVRMRRNAWPTDWDARKETIWVEWIQAGAVPHDVWTISVFQRDALWEEGCRGWRDDLEAMFPYWVVRDAGRLAAIDPTPYETVSPDDDIRAAIEASDAAIQRRLK
jgi:hypothetical protein